MGGNDNEPTEPSYDLLKHSETQSYKGKSSVGASLINLLNSIIGVGVLTIPYSFKLDGYGLGLIFLIINFLLTHLTYQYLAEAAEYTGHFQYRNIAEILFGHKAWGYVISIITVIYVSGSLTAYSIAIMDNMYWWAGDTDQNYKMYRIILCVCILYIVVVPLSCLKNLDFMKFNSYVSIVCQIVVTIVIAMFYFTYDLPREEPVAFKFNFEIMTTLPLMSASMCGHFATTFVYKELRNRTPQKMISIIIINLAILLPIYMIIGFFGYFTFTSECNSDILKTIAMHAKNVWYLQVGHIAMLILIICHFPVTCYGCRMAFESIFWQKKAAPKWGTVAIVLVIVTILMLLSMFVTEISDVMDVTSTLGGSFVIFITPAFFILAIRRKEKAKWQRYVMPVIVAIMGFLQFIFSGVATIQAFTK